MCGRRRTNINHIKVHKLYYYFNNIILLLKLFYTNNSFNIVFNISLYKTNHKKGGQVKTAQNESKYCQNVMLYRTQEYKHY